MSDATAGKPRVGVIGLGAMGLGTASALLEAGLEVVGCDISPAARRVFEARGGRSVASPAELADRCEVVLLVVVSAEQVEAVLFGEQGLAGRMPAGGLVMQCATVAPSFARRLGERLAASELLMLDAPISGGAAKARAGELSVMASGAEAAFARAAPVLDAMAATVYRLGEAPGVGSSMKLVNQLLAGVHIASAAEAMALGIRMGLDPETVYEVIASGAGSSRMFEVRGPMMVAGDYDRAGMSVRVFQKDLRIIADFARSFVCPTPLFTTATQVYLAALAHGFEGQDAAALCATLERIAGFERDV